MMALSRFSKTVLLVGVVFVACALVGCGRGYEGETRSAVKGKVTLDGLPLVSGAIVFLPPEGNSSSMRTASGIIENGMYSIDESHGPNQGTYQVLITGYEQAMPASASGSEDEDEEESDDGPDPDEQSQGPQIVPAKYNDATELQVEIKPGPNEHNFPLTR